MIRLFFVGIKILMPLPCPSQEDVPPGPEDQPGVRGLGEAEASHHVAQGRDRAQLLLRARTRQSSTVTSNCHFLSIFAGFRVEDWITQTQGTRERLTHISFRDL